MLKEVPKSNDKMIDFSINTVEKLTPRWEIWLSYMIYTYLSKWNQNNLEVNTEVQKKKVGENVTIYLYSLEKAGTL